MSYGGPFIGLLAVKSKLVRRMPGRIIGKTVDKEDKEGFVLTLQTREQHIRREKATSNICTNQGLLALRSAIYLSLLGKDGLPYVANLCYQKAQYAANKIRKIKGFNLFSERIDFIKEFTVQTEYSAFKLKKEAEKVDILIDCIDEHMIKLSFTEKRTKIEIDKLIDFLKMYA